MYRVTQFSLLGLVSLCLYSSTALSAVYDWGKTGIFDQTKAAGIQQLTDNVYNDGATDGEYPQYSPSPYAWHKNGTWIVYTANIGTDLDTSRDICKIKPDGTGFENLTSGNGVEDSNASFGTDGKIYFDRYFEGTFNGFKAMRMKSDGSNVENLTEKHSGTMPEVNVRPSPDAKKIAYMSDNKLWVADSDGNNPVQVSQETPRVYFYEDDEFSWSPNSQWLAYNGDVSTLYPIFVTNADGDLTKHKTITTPSPGSDQKPSWSPDGNKIAFKRYAGSGTRQLISINSDGTGSEEVLDEANTGSDNWKELDGILAWSPDSQWIAYRKGYDDGGSTRYNAIFIVNRATKATYQLTKDYDDYNPFWSPAGNQILFHDRQDSSYSSRDDDVKLGATNNKGDILILNLIGDYGNTVPLFPWHMFLPAIQGGSK